MTRCLAGSRKANFSQSSTEKYDRQYVKDNNVEHPVPKNIKRYTQDEINEFIGYIVDKMSIPAASKKANMSPITSHRYYQYLKDRNIPLENISHKEQKSKLIDYVVHEKMSIRAASKKVNMCHTTAHKHYDQYLNSQKRNGPTRRPRVVSASKSE
jgi:hypothetical protein